MSDEFLVFSRTCRPLSSAEAAARVSALEMQHLFGISASFEESELWYAVYKENADYVPMPALHAWLTAKMRALVMLCHDM